EEACLHAVCELGIAECELEPVTIDVHRRWRVVCGIRDRELLVGIGNEVAERDEAVAQIGDVDNVSSCFAGNKRQFGWQIAVQRQRREPTHTGGEAEVSQCWYWTAGTFCPGDVAERIHERQ